MAVKIKALLAKILAWVKREGPRWVRYLYYLRFSILLWAFPLLLVWANEPKNARALMSGIVTPVQWAQYLCAGFFLIAAGFVALILARVVVINGKERFGDEAPSVLIWLFANRRGEDEWVALAGSQISSAVLFWYFFWNGGHEGVAWGQILAGLGAGTVLAGVFWYAVSAVYYLIYAQAGEGEGRPAPRAVGELPFGTTAARTLLLPRRWMGLSREAGRGTALEAARLPAVFKAISRIARFFPVRGYRWPDGGLYEGHSFALIAAVGFFTLYCVLWPLTAPVPVAGWSWVALVLYFLGGVLVIAVDLSAQPGSDEDKRRLRRWKAVLFAFILIFAVAIPLLYGFDDAERFPILALVLILVISLSWALGAIAFFADRYRVPVLTLVIVAMAIPRLFHLYGGLEEHHLSISLRADHANLPTPANVLESKLAADRGEPLIVVTSTGGGIHAAAWTAAVLGHLEEIFAQDNKLDSFHDHVLLLSTVSGGSSGLYSYLRELEPATNGGRPDWTRLQIAARCSSLEAVGWGLVYYGLPKAFLPLGPYFWPLSPGVNDLNHSPLGKDRTWALRKAFARNLDDPYCQLDPGSGQLIPLHEVLKAQSQDRSLEAALTLGNLNPMQAGTPAFTMNTTTVEGGDRFLLANYQIPYYESPGLTPQAAESFLQVYGGAQFTSGQGKLSTDLPLATAAQLSATFPYVSSAATFPAVRGMEGVHFVDGGYYDNDGTASAIEFLRAALDGLPAGSSPVRILLVEIRNSPDSPTPASCCQAWWTTPGGKSTPWGLFGQLMAPLEAFWNAGHQSVTGRNRNDLDLFTAGYKGRLTLEHFIVDDQTSVAQTGTDPLNWSLTPRQQLEVTTSAKQQYNLNKYAQIKACFTDAGQCP